MIALYGGHLDFNGKDDMPITVLSKDRDVLR
jgi:hypothetical protein